MLIRRQADVVPEPVGDAPGVTIRWYIAAPQGARRFALRLIEVQPGASTPRHTHAEEHETFVVAGEGAVWSGQGERDIHPGDAVFIPPQELHAFRSTGDVPLRFICVIPLLPGD